MTALLELADAGGAAARPMMARAAFAGAADGPPELELDPQPQTVHGGGAGAVHDQRAGPGLMTAGARCWPSRELVARARALADAGPRQLLGIAGAPGAGKSTLAERIVAAVGPAARLVPMDGFHLAQAELRRLGRADRKGAVDTFDAQRLRRAAAPAAPAGADLGLRAGSSAGTWRSRWPGRSRCRRRSGWW